MQRQTGFTGWQRLAFGLALLVSLIAFFYFFENWRGNRAWRKLVLELEARGERLDWPSFLPPPVAEQENFTGTPALAAVAYKQQVDPAALAVFEANPLYAYSFDCSVWRLAEAIDLAACADSLGDWEVPAPGDAQSISQAAAARILRALADLDPIFAELRQAAKRPFSQFRGDPNPDAVIPNFVFLRRLAYLLALRASAELALQQTDDAFADAWVLHRLAQATEAQPYLVSTMIGTAILGGMGLQTFWEGLAARQWSDGQLRQFQEAFSATDLLASFDRAMRGGERAALYQLTEGKGMDAVRHLFSGGAGDRGLRPSADQLLYRAWPEGWLRQNQIFHCQLVEQTVFASYDLKAERVYPQKCRDGLQLLAGKVKWWKPFAQLAAVGVPNVGKALVTLARTQTASTEAALACALELYRRKHGDYPSGLEDLKPEWLPRLPHDLISGQPLIYRHPEPGRFILYGVGWNGTDDGGTPESWPQAAVPGGDWLWPTVE
ncbi:MAG: hypothetical protein U1G07_23335 [Verrucomicrobiota bacterium]